jgi:agmatine deiminase
MNYRLPAEWEKHKSTIICWPHQKEDWPGKFSPIPWVYVEIIKNVSEGELVRIIVQNEKEIDKIKKYLDRAHVDLLNIEFIVTQTDRGWMRDSSPAFVKQKDETVAIKFKFNGWAKYSNWEKDKNIPTIISKVTETDLVEAVYNGSSVVLEGGSIDSNGNGTLLTTEECLLDPVTQVRNPGFAKKDYSATFRKYLGIKKIIWLGKGITGDDTHGHVDDLCRFVNDDTVVLCRESNPTEENYKSLEENFERLQCEKTADGKKINVITLPMPAALKFEDLRLPASYANFYICNSAVIVPTFNDLNDRFALNILGDLFPSKKIIGIHSVDLVWGLGTLHCLTHEEPA